MKIVRWFRPALLAIFFCSLLPSGAHPALFTSAHIYIQPDGQYQLFTSFDLLAFALHKTSVEISDPEMNALLDGPPETLAKTIAAARTNFIGTLELPTDRGAGLISQLKFPTMKEINEWKASGENRKLPIVASVEVDGRLPANASQLRFQFPVSLGTVVLTVDLPGGGVYDEPIDAGTFSSLIAVHLQQSGTAPSPASGPSPTGLWVWLRYIFLGIKHIIPEGADHICFVLGLFLLNSRTTFLLWQVTAFTLAHSITLALSLYGVVQLPTSIVEPGIALSIVFIAVENLVTNKVSFRRLFVVLGCGLIHGLGFASALKQTGLPKRDFLSALLGFNLGVELGQLIVIVAAFLMVGWFRGCPWYRRRVVVPASLLIAFIAVCWFFQRIL
jgi:hypothetical protein